ncbi:MAG: hypothetical protein PVG55_00630 [Nitrospirota bacterium]|jgi:hypothetical protein
MRKSRKGFFDRPEVKSAIRKVFFMALLLLVALDFFVTGHPHFPWEGIAGFYAFYGFLSCAVIVAVSKVLGKFWLQKGEDYYDE